jgi:hypothetical protein
MATRLEPIDILTKSLQGSKQDPNRVHTAMANLVKKDPKFRVMRSNNSLFSYYNLGNGNVDVALDTADTPRDLVKSIKDFVQAMKAAGFKRGRFSMQNPQMEKILKMMGLQYKLQPTPSGQMMAVVEVGA